MNRDPIEECKHAHIYKGGEKVHRHIHIIQVCIHEDARSPLDENANGVRHKLLGHFENFMG